MSEEKIQVEVEDDNVEIEVVDDRPPEDRNAKTLDVDPAEIPDDEINQYSKQVQKRIQQLKHGYHDERRAKEEAAREREAALNYAKQIAEENAKLKEKLVNGESTLIKTVQYAMQKELAEAEKQYKNAVETQDADQILAAQKALNQAMMKSERAQSFKPHVEQQLQPVEQPVYNEQQVRKTDPKAEKWKNQNPWFGPREQPGTNTVMTHFAVGVHNELTYEYGDHYALTDEYYEKINSRVRDKFPEYFGDQGAPEEKPKRPATVVAPASRSYPPKKIKLTASEASMAKRIGVPLEDYARHMAKLKMEGKL